MWPFEGYSNAFLQGHGFSRADTLNRLLSALDAEENRHCKGRARPSALKPLILQLSIRRD